MKPGVLRLSIMLLGFLVLLGVLIARLADIQLVSHRYYQEIAGSQHGFERTLPAARGAILDRKGRPLAASLPVYRVSADPGLIEDVDSTAYKLAQVMSVHPQSISRKLAAPGSRYEVIEPAVDVETGLEVKGLDLPGVWVEAVGSRVRPLGDVACNVTGSLSAYEDPLGGIELTCDHILRGRSGMRRYLRDGLGNPRPCVEAIVRLPVGGNSVVLTIDADLQLITERALEAAVDHHGAKGGCVVIVDPASGEILTMASVSDNANFPVRAIFEPGSSLKVCTFAAALDLGRVNSDEMFDTKGGKLEIPGGWIRDDHPRDYPLSLKEAFAISSNVAASMIARRIGEADLHRYLRAFGFGSRTGLPLEGESRGILREPHEWSRRSLETLAIGQEIGVTAVQLTMAYAAVANRGVLMEPRLVAAIIDKRGRIVKKYPAKTVRRVIRQETADKMVSLLESVVLEGTGVPAGINGIRVAGKTGTGQKAANGHYIAGKYYSVFAGIIPAGRPEYVCLVMLDEPSAEGHYGGPVCGPVFKEIMCSLLRRDKSVFPETCAHLAALRANLEQVMPAVVSSSRSDLETRSTGRDGQVFPSVVGLTLRDAARVLTRAGLEWRGTGSGVVVRQWPGAGEAVGNQSVCKLTLKSAP